MRLPLSSSLPSVGSSDDGALARHLLLAGTNAEVNRISCGEFDNESDVLSSPRTPNPCFERVINFNPQVSVRFIRPRSNTIQSSLSDWSASMRYLDSPIAPDATQELKECCQDSDDDEFDRFYRTMLNPPRLGVPFPHSRRFSLDNVDENAPSHESGRPRSVSCDDFVFQSMKLGG